MLGLLLKWAIRGVIFIIMIAVAAFLVPNLLAQSPQDEAVKVNKSWPPVLGKPYPNLKLMDHRGEEVRLSQFKGKVIIVEPIGMNCPACNAWSGAEESGGYEGIVPQQGLASFENDFWNGTDGLQLNDDRVVFVQLLLYDMQLKAPTAEDAQKWAAHFGLDKQPNYYVLAGNQELLGKSSYDMIPGFHLIDKDFIFRFDSSGHHPKHSLYNELLPMVPELIAARTAFNQQFTVEEAYQAIPHRQTTFDYSQAGMDTVEAEYLEQLFALVDISVIERVETPRRLFDRDNAGNYETILRKLDSLDVPPNLLKLHSLLIEAVEAQSKYFEQFREQGLEYHFDSSDPLIKESSAKLREAYAELLLKYPFENSHNKDAFFDHLCALDFV